MDTRKLCKECNTPSEPGYPIGRDGLCTTCRLHGREAEEWLTERRAERQSNPPAPLPDPWASLPDTRWVELRLDHDLDGPDCYHATVAYRDQPGFLAVLVLTGTAGASNWGLASLWTTTRRTYGPVPGGDGNVICIKPEQQAAWGIN